METEIRILRAGDEHILTTVADGVFDHPIDTTLTASSCATLDTICAWASKRTSSWDLRRRCTTFIQTNHRSFGSTRSASLRRIGARALQRQF